MSRRPGAAARLVAAGALTLAVLSLGLVLAPFDGAD